MIDAGTENETVLETDNSCISSYEVVLRIISH